MSVLQSVRVVWRCGEDYCPDTPQRNVARLCKLRRAWQDGGPGTAAPNSTQSGFKYDLLALFTEALKRHHSGD